MDVDEDDMVNLWREFSLTEEEQDDVLIENEWAKETLVAGRN